MCQSHTGHMTGLWFLPARPLRLNTNEWMNEYIYINKVHGVTSQKTNLIMRGAQISCNRIPSKLPTYHFYKENARRSRTETTTRMNHEESQTENCVISGILDRNSKYSLSTRHGSYFRRESCWNLPCCTRTFRADRRHGKANANTANVVPQISLHS